MEGTPMQANCLETNPNQVSQDDSMKLGVLLMHEDLATGLRGKHALDQVAERLSQKAEFCVHLWRFDLMKEESFRSQAVEDAREANIVVLAMRDHAELPPPVRTWFEEWLENRGGVPCAVVVSLDSEAQA